MLKQLKKTNTLQLRIMNDLTHIERLNEIARSLRYLKELKSLDFTIPYENPNKINTFKLTKTLKVFKELTSFSLNSGWGAGLDVAKICKGLKTMTKLKNLNLFFACSGLRNTDMYELADALSQLKELKHFTLDISRNSISLDGFNAIMQGLQNLTQLEELDIVFNHNLALAENFIVFKNSMQALTQLKSLNLNLSNIKIFRDSLKDLGDGIGHLKNLKVLSLCLIDCHLNEKQIINLGKGIQQLKELTELDLDLTNNQLYDKETSEFLECFKSLHEIKKFSLTLSKNLIGDSALVTVIKNLSNYKNLESITLNAFSCRVTDYAIGKLNTLCDLEKLKEFILLFSKNGRIKDEGVRKFMDCLPDLKDLKVIRIDFAGCQLTSEIEDFYIEKLKTELPECNSTLLFSH